MIDLCYMFRVRMEIVVIIHEISHYLIKVKATKIIILETTETIELPDPAPPATPT